MMADRGTTLFTQVFGVTASSKYVTMKRHQCQTVDMFQSADSRADLCPCGGEGGIAFLMHDVMHRHRLHVCYLRPYQMATHPYRIGV
ncbi:hypothetical protein JOB18_010561 [Solea senegalensis]|uniref:Uncharacterized protein n=1 Tax=Solea senegalensis TaxID=28829 RepID=A0AAV6R6D2_SOLSE|nr:hypothetical protein JOB18_010561 [Solea senegalensis]